MLNLLKSIILALFVFCYFSNSAAEESVPESEYAGFFVAKIDNVWYKLSFEKITPDLKLRKKIIGKSITIIDLKTGRIILDKKQRHGGTNPYELDFLRKIPDSTDRIKDIVK